MSRELHDRQITIFSPDGKLYQIEYTLKAVESEGTLGVGVRGTNTVCLAAPKKVADRLLDAAYVTNLYRITPQIGALGVGNKPDCCALVEQARSTAFKFQDKNGYPCPVHVLAEKMSKFVQIRTQNAGMRPLAGALHLMSVDDERGGQLYRIDAAGLAMGWKACATGPKHQEALNCLEKLTWLEDDTSKNPVSEKVDSNRTIRGALDCLQRVLEQDLKPTDVEVAIVEGNGGYRMLTAQEIDDHMTAIHEDLDGRA